MIATWAGWYSRLCQLVTLRPLCFEGVSAAFGPSRSARILVGPVSCPSLPAGSWSFVNEWLKGSNNGSLGSYGRFYSDWKMSDS